MNAPIMAEIGKYYKVPCPHIPQSYCGSTWVPVLGPKHSDLEINFTQQHFHIDWRFATERLIFGRQFPHAQVITCNGEVGNFAMEIYGEPVLKRRKCRRGMPDFPSIETCAKQRARNFFVQFENAKIAECAKLIDGHTCPHKGIDLRPFEKPDGTAICPGHGLKFNMRTGEIMPHHTRGITS